MQSDRRQSLQSCPPSQEEEIETEGPWSTSSSTRWLGRINTSAHCGGGGGGNQQRQRIASGKSPPLKSGPPKQSNSGSQNRKNWQKKKQQETKFLAVKNSQSALPDLENWRN